MHIANDFINFELQRDPRLIVLYGLSAGGMLAYHAAALNKKFARVVGMIFLDQRVQQVRDKMAKKNIFMSRVGIPLARMTDIPLLKSRALPMSLVSKMSALLTTRLR